MGIQIVENIGAEAVLYDSTTMWAFGPVFEGKFDAEQFLKWCDEVKGQRDIRRWDEKELQDAFKEWSEIDWEERDDEECEAYGPFKVAF